MAVITTDILLKGIRRDQVYAWLSDVKNHDALLENAFEKVTRQAEGEFEITVPGPVRSRKMGYKFEQADDSHGGRRILITVSGKRTRGKLHYSLRTLKPSTNTLVTLHMDYDPGTMLGMLVNSSGLKENLEKGWADVLARLSEIIPREV